MGAGVDTVFFAGFVSVDDRMLILMDTEAVHG
jgi:hypothetical protein